MEPVLQAIDLVKVYGKGSARYEALRGVSLAIYRGESVAIVGKSGSGKSTLMHLLAGLDRPTAGEVQFFGRPLSKMNDGQRATARNRQVGFVFQQFFLQPALTVQENVALPLMIGGTDKQERLNKAAGLLTEVTLQDKAKNRATDLSGGEKQRVAIARAIAGSPQVLFADEPTGNLDTETSHRIIDLLFRLRKERDITLILVTHDVELAALCDRRVLMKDGQVEEDHARH